jgi:Tol biopolymer transport system component
MSDHSARETQRCPQCGAEFVPTSSPLGVCPACLLKLGASDPAMKASSIEPGPLAGSEPVSWPAVPARKVRRVWWVLIGAAVAVLLVLFASAVVRRSVGAVPAPASGVIRFTVPWPDDAEAGGSARFAVSPDGSRIVMAARHQDGETRLWMRTLQSMEWRALSNTEGAAQPFWSPDSRHIGFFAQRKLKKVDVSSGLLQTLADAPSSRGGTWGRENTIVFAPTPVSGLHRVSSSGGDAQPLTQVEGAESDRGYAWPHFLPDGRTVLFSSFAPGDSPGASESNGSARSGLYLLSLATGDRRLLVEGAGAGIFAQGFLLFIRGPELMAQPFDLVRAELTGVARSISGAERVGGVTAGGGFTASENGILVHRTGGPVPSQLIWFDRNGEARGAASASGNYQQFSISPDGRRVAVGRSDDQGTTAHLWLIELDRQLVSRLTSSPSYDASPLWFPDGQRVAFVARRNGQHMLCVTDANSDGQEQVLHKAGQIANLEDVSPDARFLIYSTVSSRTGSDLWLLTLADDRKNADGKPQPLFQSAFNESDGRLSPDGRWVAYVSDESGRDEVYVRSFPPAGGRWQITAEGGNHPRWRRDGRELFFVSADRALHAVDVRDHPPFQSGAPRMLFPMRHADEYQVSADGRFLARTRMDDRGSTALQVVVNWIEELQTGR